MAYRFDIKVSEEELWGDLDPLRDGYNVDASGVQYAEMLCDAIADEYPDAEVDVNYSASSGRTDIYPDTEDEFVREDEIREDLDRIAEKVWTSYPWEVEQESD